MTAEKTSGKSFFKEYFLFKLKKIRGFAAALAALNFVCVIVCAVCLICMQHRVMHFDEEEAYSFYSSDFILQFAILGAILCAFAAAVIMMILPALHFKMFNDRAAADTIVSLPVTYRERFWGDFLSGLSANIMSFVPCAVIAEILMAITQNGPVKALVRKMNDSPLYKNRDYYLSSIRDDFAGTAFKVIITLLICYIAAYCIGTFVTSCCGKLSSAVIFSFAGIFALAAFVTSAGAMFSMYAKGVVFSEVKFDSILYVPLIGMIYNAVNFIFQGTRLLAERPLYIIIHLVIISMLLVGAYFLGKRRKTESIGRDFVYGAVYHIIMLTALSSVINIIFISALPNGVSKSYDKFFFLIIALAAYAFFEFIRYRKFKKMLISAARFTGVFAVCLVSWSIVRATSSFGIGDFIPSAASVREVQLSGESFYFSLNGDGRDYIYRDREAIRSIENEHRKLLEYDLDLGRNLNISYILKDGREIKRFYGNTTEQYDSIDAFVAEVKKLPMYNTDIYGFLSDPEYDELTVYYVPSEYDTNCPRFTVKPEKTDELIRMLKYDIENKFSEVANWDTRSIVEFNYTRNGESKSDYYRVQKNFLDVVEFVNNPDNFVDNEETVRKSAHFTVIYSDDSGKAPITRMNVIFDDNDPSMNVQYLLKNIERADDIGSGTKISDKFVIFKDDGDSGEYVVRRDNENSAALAMMDLFEEQLQLKVGS